MKFYLFTWLEKSYMHLEGVENFLRESDFRIKELEHSKGKIKAKFEEWSGFSPVFIQDSEGLAWIKAEVSKGDIKEAKKRFFELLDRIIQGCLPIRHSLMVGGTFAYTLNYLVTSDNEEEIDKLNEEKDLPLFYKEKNVKIYQTKPELYFTSKITWEEEMKGEIDKFETLVFSKEKDEKLIEHLVFYNLWEMMLKKHMRLAVSKRKKIKEINEEMRKHVTLGELKEADEKISDLIKDITEVDAKISQSWQCFKRKAEEIERDFFKELYDIAKADGEYYDVHMDRITAYANHIERIIDIRNTYQESVESRKLESIFGVEAASVVASLLVSTVVATELGFKSNWFKLALTILIWLLIYLAARGVLRWKLGKS